MSTHQETLSIEGMHCDHCVDVVREALADVDGVTVQDVEIGSAEVTVDESTASHDQLVAAVEDAGYDVSS